MFQPLHVQNNSSNSRTMRKEGHAEYRGTLMMIASPHVRAHDHGGGWSSVPQGDRDSRCSRWPPWRINSRRANCKHCENGRVCTSVLSFLREIFSFSFFFVIVFSTSLEIAIEALFKLESKHPLRAPIERLVYYRQIQRDTHGSLSQNRQTRESTTTMRTRVHTHSVPSPFRVSADVVDRFDSQAPVSKEKQHGIQRGRNNTRGFRGGR